MTTKEDNRFYEVQCPNCLAIFYERVKVGRRKKYCSDRCRKNYWNDKNKSYYKDYYRKNREKILKYYQQRKDKYKKMRMEYYKGKKEIMREWEGY